MMVQRLKSYFGNPIALKSFGSGLLGTLIIGMYAMGTFPILVKSVGFLLFLYIYLKLLDRKSVIWSFWVVVFGYLIGIGYADQFLSLVSPGVVWTGIVLSFFLLFLLVIGTGNYLFEDRKGMYGVLNTAVLFLNFLVFGSLASAVSWVWYIPLFVGSVLVIREFMGFMKVPFPVRNMAFALVFGLFFIELFIVAGFLPLGSIHTAVFATLLALVLKNIGLLHFSGTLSKRAFLREISIFIICTLIVFAASRWTI